MPHWLRRVGLRLRATLWRQHARDVHDELQLHLELLEEDYRAKGLGAADARRRAHLDFGNRTRIQETSVELVAFAALLDIVQDARYAVRQTTRNPGFTSIAVFSLAIGIGAVSTAFTLLDAFVLRRLPVDRPDQLVVLSSDRSGWRSWTYPAFRRWRDAPETRLDVAAASDEPRVDVGDPDHPAELRVGLVSSEYFRVVGARIARGRDLTADDDRAPGARPVAVISDALWDRRFARNDDLSRLTIDLNAVRYEVVGIAAAPFAGHQVGHPVDVWIPIAMQSSFMPEAGALLEDRWGTGPAWLHVIGRLRSGVSLETAATSVNLVSQRFAAEQTGALGSLHPQVVRAQKQTVTLVSAATGYAPERRRYGVPLQILTAVTALLLLVACANFMNLVLARARAHRRELAIRSALGAGTWRLILQALMECGVLGSAAGVLGILASSWATVATLKYFSAAIQPIAIDSTPGLRTIALAMVSVAVVIAFGLAPWVRMVWVPGPTAISRTPGPVAVERRRTRGWRLVLVAQLALCTALSLGTGVLLRSVINLRTQDLGFDRNVLMVSASSMRASQNERAASMLMARVMERLAALPGVEDVAVSAAGFLDNAFYWVDGSQLLTTDRGAAAPGVPWTRAAVGARFFEVVGMPMVHGRGFTDADTATGSSVVVINQSLARLLFGDADPVGRRLGTTRRGPDQEIIGVVNDVKQTSPRDRGLGVVYVPMRAGDRWIVAVRTTGDPSRAAPIVRRALTSLDTPVRVDRIRTIAESVDAAITQERLTCALAFILGALVILVGSVGLYALIANDVGQQAREIGIRLALGASRRAIATLVLRDAGTVVVAALVLGVPLGIAALRPLAPQMYLVKAADPLTLGLVAVLLPALALLAAWRPARKASRIDPATLLRCD